MHEIEPFFMWRYYYVSEEDENSPFYQREYSEFGFKNTVYNYCIHPQWDEFGSSTLYLKIIYADYNKNYAIIELIGEWNDCITNDIMYLKSNVTDVLAEKGINKFILIGENVMNLHCDMDDYYAEWFDEIDDGWIVGINFRDHVVNEFITNNIDYYIMFEERFDKANWRSLKPDDLFEWIEELITKKISTTT
ncbi:MAG: hypothetical protein U9R42_03650 [Bacteroidota bacterium]|nr:hypothetical protein [Bacteroidota bacterium]